MAFTIGSGTFTNGSATVTGVTLTSGTLAYFASGTRMVVGVNPVIQEVEAIAAPTVSTITLRSAWTGTGGTYSFLANQTSEGLRDAVQAIRTNNASLQSFIDSIDTAATADSVAQRDASGQLTATNLITADKIIHDGDTNTAIRFPAADTVTVETDGAERLRIDSSGNVGVGNANPASILDVSATTPTVIVRDNRGSASWTSGVELGKIDFYTSDSTGIGAHSIASIGVVANGTNTASPDGVIKFSTGAYNSLPTEKMRIDPFGNVGIGTSSPSRKLDVAGSASRFLFDVNVADAEIRSTNAAGSAFTPMLFNAEQLYFETSNTERMRIDSSGNVLVGVTGQGFPTPHKEVIGVPNGSQYGLGLRPTDGDFTYRAISLGSYSSATIGSIDCTTTATSYNTSSDYRLKEDWHPMVGNIDRLMQLKPCNFAWKVDGSRVDGFLAHEAQEVVPEAVTGEKDAVKVEQYEVEPAVYEDVVIPAEFDEEGNEVSPERTEQKLVKEVVMGEREVPQYQGIDQAKLVPLLTAALQDAIKEIEALKARIEALEG